MMTKARHCIVQRHMFYNVTRLNQGQNEFRPGDKIFILPSDSPRLLRLKHVRPVEADFDVEILAKEIDRVDIFPKTSQRIWVFGDGPTAPSAKEKIKEEDVVFAVNHCFYQPLNLIPDYYVALDEGMMLKETEKIKDLRAIRKFTNRANSESSKFNWPELRLFDVRGELGFSEELLEIYHGKTSCFVALQLAVQCGLSYIDKGLEIHLGGVDLATLDSPKHKLTHHYGSSAFREELFPRMLASIRYGLNYLNERKIKWINHSPLLASRVEDLSDKNLSSFS